MTIFNGIWGVLNILLIVFSIISFIKIVLGKSSQLNKLMAILLVVGFGLRKKEDFKYETKEPGTETSTINTISFNKDFLTENHLIYISEGNTPFDTQNAKVSRVGFVSGTQWKTKLISNDGGKIKILGEVKYKLLGIPIFCISKENTVIV